MSLYVLMMLIICAVGLIGLVICVIVVQRKSNRMYDVYDELKDMGDLTGVPYVDIESLLGEPNLRSERSDGYLEVSWNFDNGCRNSNLEQSFKLNAIFDADDYCVKYRLSTYDGANR